MGTPLPGWLPISSPDAYSDIAWLSREWNAPTGKRSFIKATQSQATIRKYFATSATLLVLVALH